nr:MAG TPA: hypothetical protein [Caudoviricetes sp.]
MPILNPQFVIVNRKSPISDNLEDSPISDSAGSQ